MTSKERERDCGDKTLGGCGDEDVMQWAGSETEPTLTLVIGPAWAWYSLNSFCRGRGYFMARTVPIEVPTNIMRPECEMTIAV